MSTLKYWAQKWFPQISQIDEINKQSLQQTDTLSKQHKTLHDRFASNCPNELVDYFYHYASTLEKHGRQNKTIDFSSEPDKMVSTLKQHLEQEKQLSAQLEEALAHPSQNCHQLKLLLKRAMAMDESLSK